MFKYIDVANRKIVRYSGVSIIEVLLYIVISDKDIFLMCDDQLCFLKV